MWYVDCCLEVCDDISMYKVEYLILVNNSKSSCTTVGALLHLLQSDADIKIDKKGLEVSYKAKLFTLSVVQGTAESSNDDDTKKNTYFHMTISCSKEDDLLVFSALLRSIRKVVAPLLLTPAALQVLWDDISILYGTEAYPHISRTENLMRKLITKFMHINLGAAWAENRIPDDVQKSINAANSETTYLYNVDFIKLKDILLSESYSRDRDTLLKELKNAKKEAFKREEINALIPMSNWEKYFSTDVDFDAEELSNLWSQLYDLRCKVAHNKTFTLDDLNLTISLTKKIDPLLTDAINKLDHIHVDKNEADKILGDAVANASRSDSPAIKSFMNRYASLSRTTYQLTTPLNKKGPRRKFMQDVLLMKTAGYISADDVDVIKRVSEVRNILVHNINNSRDINEINDLSMELDIILSKLHNITQNKVSRNESI